MAVVPVDTQEKRGRSGGRRPSRNCHREIVLAGCAQFIPPEVLDCVYISNTLQGVCIRQPWCYAIKPKGPWSPEGAGPGGCSESSPYPGATSRTRRRPPADGVEPLSTAPLYLISIVFTKGDAHLWRRGERVNASQAHGAYSRRPVGGQVIWAPPSISCYCFP